MKPVLIIRHATIEGPGFLEDFLYEHNIPCKLIKIDQGDKVPTNASDYSGIAMMGGPMSVNDDLPWISDEITLILNAAKLDIPLIGHCLGGQMISKAFGARVSANKVKEIGWGIVSVSENDEAKKWFGNHSSFLGFHWHGETFSMPPGAERLAASAYCANQMFVIGKHLAMQCHVEMTPALIEGIAHEYVDKGRLLMVSTTNLDMPVGVLWNLGAIAASGHPKALDTVRRILLASAAIPGAFPPSMFDVTLDGRAYQEMHVDGGAFVQSFLYPGTLTEARRERLARHQKVPMVEAYVIRNGRLDSDWAEVRRQMLGIAGRAISTMITASGYNDLVRMYYTTTRDNIGFQLAYIGSDFDRKLPSPFDQAYMRALFDYGFQKARHGYPWASKPPYVG